MITLSPKDPNSVEPITFDFSHRLSEIADDELDSIVQVAIDDGDSNLNLDAQFLVSPYVTQWLSGGTLGTWYTIRARVTTTAGRTLDMSAKLKIEQD
jgi:hypothetical protein